MQDLWIKTKGTELSERQLDEFLTSRALEIPLIFREFLLVYNGASVKKNSFKQLLSFVTILPLMEEGSASIAQILEGYEVDLGTKEWFPFAIDSGGWVFVLSLNSSRTGQVWLDRFDSGDENPFKLIAQSFEEFIESLEVKEA